VGGLHGRLVSSGLGCYRSAVRGRADRAAAGAPRRRALIAGSWVAAAGLLLLTSCPRDPATPLQGIDAEPRPAPEWSAWTPEPRDLLAHPIEPLDVPWALAFEPMDPDGLSASTSGLSRPETGAQRPFVWSSAPQTLVRFRLPEGPRPLELVLRGRPFEFPGAPPQRITVSMAGQEVGVLELAAGGMRDLRLRLPLGAQRRGLNTLGLAYARATAPADVLPGSSDPRPLGVAYEAIRIVQAGPTLEAVSLGPDAALRQTEPGAFSYVLRLPERAELGLAWVAPAAGESVGVRVELEHDAGAETLWQATVAPDGARGTRRLDLGRFGGRAVRLRFALDGLRADAPWLWTALALDAPRAEAPPPPAARGLNVVLVVLDASSRARFGAYGAPGDTTPHVDALAREGLVFEDAHSHAPYTLASTASLFTSRTPPEHGVVEKTDRLDGQLPTLAEHLRQSGYATACFSGNIFVARRFGMDRGFETFEELFRGRTGGRVALATDFDAPVGAWLHEAAARARDGSRPFFLYLHYVQPHEPYDAGPPEFYRGLDPGYQGRIDGSVDSMYAIYEGRYRLDADELERLRRLYEGNLRFADAAVGRLVERLRALDLLERTLVIVTSDHGEALGERGLFGHNTSVDESMTAIPLVVRLPGALARRGRVAWPVATIDLAPMILESVGIEPPAGFDGINPLRGLEAADAGGARLLGARSTGPEPHLAFWLDGFKYVYDPWTGPVLTRGPDPDRGEDVRALHPVTADLFEAARRAWRAQATRVGAAAAAPLSHEEREALRALGYLAD
jgi:arylsulfatase A-like enzyme